MLAQMAWQILKAQTEIKVLGDSLLCEIKTSSREMPVQCVIRASPFKVTHQSGQFIECLCIEAKHLANFARCQPPSIGNNVCRHCGTELSITLIDILNRLLAIIARRKIEIDVRPFAALLGEKPLKQQLHSNGINSRNAERVTDRAVGRGTSALHQNTVLIAEAND